jgi:ABC-2 type transport system ATP-binding protein
MMENSAISINHLHKQYGEVHALRGLSLNIERGEIFGFLGPNGAGKTTTLRCMLDLIRPSSGEIRVLGIDPQVDPVLVRARTGYLPGELNLDGNQTGAALIRYFNQLRGGIARAGRAQELAERLELDLTLQIKNLSHGNKQKIGLIQALMHDPELILLDEPTTGLDPLIQRELLHILHEASEAGQTVFFSSHIISVVERIANRVGIIRKGRLIEVADTSDLLTRAVRRATIRFREPIDPTAFRDLKGVEIISPDSGKTIHLQIMGDMDGLIKRLAEHPVIEIETERPTLEEIFMAYYSDNKSEV